MDKSYLLVNHNNVYSEYFNVYNYEKHVFGYHIISIQLLVMCSVFWLNMNSDAVTILLLCDSVCAMILFISNYMHINLETYFYQVSYFNRILYVTTIAAIYYIINMIIPHKCYYGPLLMAPHVIEYTINLYYFRKISRQIYNICEDIIHHIICKQTIKILNSISNEYLQYEPHFRPDEIKPFVKRISSHIFINFACAIIFASILKYFESNGTTFITGILRQYFFKQYSSKKINKKDYLIGLMKDRQWSKLLDAYTLNKIICLYIEKTTQDDGIIIYINKIIIDFVMNFNKIMTCWTISALFNNRIGFLGFIIFIDKKYAHIQLFAICLGALINSNEQLLYLTLCKLLMGLLSCDLLF